MLNANETKRLTIEATTEELARIREFLADAGFSTVKIIDDLIKSGQVDISTFTDADFQATRPLAVSRIRPAIEAALLELHPHWPSATLIRATGSLFNKLDYRLWFRSFDEAGMKVEPFLPPEFLTMLITAKNANDLEKKVIAYLEKSNLEATKQREMKMMMIRDLADGSLITLKMALRLAYDEAESSKITS